MFFTAVMRRLRRSPGFFLTVFVLTAAAIAVNTVVLSAIWALQWQALPFPNGERLVRLEAEIPRFGMNAGLNDELLSDLVLDEGVFAGVFGYASPPPAQASDSEGRPWQLATIDPQALAVLATAPALGRGFSSTGAEGELLLSDRQWRGQFGADPDILGRSVRLGGTPHVVIGVMPPTFAFPDRGTEGWLVRKRRNDDGAGVGSVQVVARLQPGVTPAAAASRLDAVIAASEPMQASLEHLGLIGRVTPLRQTMADRYLDSLGLLALASALLLLVVAANLAILVLDRWLARQAEFSISRALGARRRHLLLSALADPAVPVLAGGLAGLALVTTGLRFLQHRSLLPEHAMVAFGEPLPALAIGLAGTLALLLAVAVILLLMRALVPAAAAVSHGRRLVSGRERLRPGLLVAQVALATALVGAGSLLLHSAWQVLQAPRGFDEQHVLLAAVDLGGGHAAAGDEAARQALQARHQAQMQAAREAILALPGVEAVSLASMPPFSGAAYMVSLGDPGGDPGEHVQAYQNQVDADYFRVMRIPLTLGRGFAEGDFGEARPVIVDQTWQRRLLAGADPLGARLPGAAGLMEGLGNSPIIGVAGAVRHERLDRDDELPMIYQAAPAGGWPRAFVLLRTAVPPGQLAGPVRDLIRAHVPQARLEMIGPLADLLQRSLGERRAVLEVVGLFALLALALTGLGLYSVISVMVRRRTAELGLRMALGASTAQIQRLVLARGGVLVGLGLAVGWLLGRVLARQLEAHLYGIDSADAATWSLALVLVAGAGLLACWLPARRAARLSPMQALAPGH
ncbi:MAG: ABC transporter permease [Xanthomonadales bacterium]|nr:ABC transporter permease [Xanthomonadales bacterium]